MNRAVILAFFMCLVSYDVSESKKAYCSMNGKNGISDTIGMIYLSQENAQSKVEIDYKLEKLVPENTKHGFHVHVNGDLSNNCTAAGPHFNPTTMNHGGKDDSVRHVGDLGNILATNGVASGKIVDGVLSLYEMNSVIGRSFVVHEGEDDMGKGGHNLSLTTGNSGGRLQCCTIIESSAFKYSASFTTIVLSILTICFASLA